MTWKVVIKGPLFLNKDNSIIIVTDLLVRGDQTDNRIPSLGPFYARDTSTTCGSKVAQTWACPSGQPWQWWQHCWSRWRASFLGYRWRRAHSAQQMSRCTPERTDQVSPCSTSCSRSSWARISRWRRLLELRP